MVNVIRGTAGSDYLVGTDGADDIYGGDGNDAIDGRLGDDFLFGENGDDYFFFSAISVDNQDHPYGLISGGSGYDIVDLSGLSPTRLTWNDSEQTIRVGSQSFNLDTVEEIWFGDESNYLGSSLGTTTEYSSLNVFLGGGNDTAFLQGAININGEAGDDRFFLSPLIGTGFTSYGVVHGGSGSDTIQLNIGFLVDLTAGYADSFSSHYLLTGIENVEGVASADPAYTSLVFGNDNANRITVWSDDTTTDHLGVLYSGAGGNDYLSGSNGRDDLYGDAGSDTLQGGTGDDLLDGGRGSDTASYANADERVVVSLALAGAAQATGAGRDTLISIENLLGSAFDDRLTGDDASNTIAGGGGNDRLYGGIGNDRLEGDAGNDRLFGQDGNDTLLGGDGDDYFRGGAGTDSLRGGAGNDYYELAAGDAGDAVVEYSNSGTDTVQVGFDYTLTANVENLRMRYGDWEGTGNGLDNVLLAHGGANVLEGLGGNDTLYGGTGRDTLVGGAGNDRLFGQGSGDILTGGDGADRFIFDSLAEFGEDRGDSDIITDFSQAQGDRINLDDVDANTTLEGDQAFTFIGENAFSGTAGELRYIHDNGRTIVEMDVNGDGAADAFLRLDGEVDLMGRDFFF